MTVPPPRTPMPPAPVLPDHQEVMATLQLRSRLERTALQARHPVGPADVRLHRPAVGAALRTVAAPSPGHPVEDLQRRRASVRTYADRDVPVEVVAAVVAGAGQFDLDAFADDAAGAGLHLLVAARHVAGLAPGLYAGEWQAGRFAWCAPLPSGPAAADLVLQLEYADAPATVLVCGSLAAALARHGDHGHRLLLARAGAAAHAGWLTALDHDLAGSVYAGFLAAALRPLAGVDGWHRTQLLALSFGYPADPGAAHA